MIDEDEGQETVNHLHRQLMGVSGIMIREGYDPYDVLAGLSYAAVVMLHWLKEGDGCAVQDHLLNSLIGNMRHLMTRMQSESGRETVQ